MTPPTIGDLNPEIAKKFGLDAAQMEMLSAEVKRWEGRIYLATFVTPPTRPDGKNDPIAYLPPGYTRYGIIDRDHRSRVSVGETWLVEAIEKIPGTPFLIPLVRLELKNLLDLQPGRLQELATAIATKNPTVAKELAAKLPTPPKPKVEAELESLKKETQRLQAMLESATKDKASLETELGLLKAQKLAASAAPQPSGTGLKAAPVQRRDGALPPAGGVSVEPPNVPIEGSLRRQEGETVESPLLIQPAYEIHFSGDLYRILFRPSTTGVPCNQGKVVVRGLARVDTRPAPTEYPMVWDGRAGGFVAYIGRG